jgi:hypothetical protein
LMGKWNKNSMGNLRRMGKKRPTNNEQID